MNSPPVIIPNQTHCIFIYCTEVIGSFFPINDRDIKESAKLALCLLINLIII
jgi:hypothetical protein